MLLNERDRTKNERNLIQKVERLAIFSTRLEDKMKGIKTWRRSQLRLKKLRLLKSWYYKSNLFSIRYNIWPFKKILSFKKKREKETGVELQLNVLDTQLPEINSRVAINNLLLRKEWDSNNFTIVEVERFETMWLHYETKWLLTIYLLMGTRLLIDNLDIHA